jgi:hypothetical protein
MATLNYGNDNRWQRNMTWSLDGLSRSLYKQCSNNPLLTLLSLAPQLRPKKNCQRYLSSHIDILQQGSARIRIFFYFLLLSFFPALFRDLLRPLWGLKLPVYEAACTSSLRRHTPFVVLVLVFVKIASVVLEQPAWAHTYTPSTLRPHTLVA